LGYVAGAGAAIQDAAQRQSWEMQKTETYDQQRARYEAEKRARWHEKRQHDGTQGAS
jgi:hypothetical protein